MRQFFLISLFLWITGSVFGQDSYKIYGPQQIQDPCEFYQYTLESSAQLESTVWKLVAFDGTLETILTGTTYSVQVMFPYPGGFYIIAISLIDSTQQRLLDTLPVFVYGTSITPEIVGCYELNPGTKCYDVCAFSTTTILIDQPNNIEVSGAESYTSDGFSYIEIIWGAGGHGEVLLNSLCGTSICFEILPEPTAAFTTDPPYVNDTLIVCKNKTVNFFNSSFNGLSYTWNFGDGNQNQEYHTSHTYDIEGFYTVSLVANTICECSDEKQIVIQVLPQPAPSLDCVNTVCPETRQHYNATTDGCSDFTWTVSSNGTVVNGGGPADDFIEIIWHEGPDGLIELAVANCNSAFCSTSSICRIPIMTPDGPIEGDASVCSSEIVNYSAPYFPGTQYDWTVGPHGKIVGSTNTNAVVVEWDEVFTPQSSFVSVVYDNCFLECGGSATLSISLAAQIVLQADAQVCQNATAQAVTISGFSPGSPVPVAWHIEDESGTVLYTEPLLSGSFSHVFNYPAGVYQWVGTNTSTSYCTEVVRQNIVVTASPDTPLGIKGDSIICPGQPYGYTIDAAGIFSTVWNVTDGSNSYLYSGQTITHTFGSTPPYSVSAAHANIQYASCQSDPVTIQLTTIDAYSISGPVQICINSISTHAVPPAIGGDFSWEIIPADRGVIRNGNLNQVEIFWTTSGAATIRLRYCGTMVDQPVTILQLPNFNLIGPLAACANEVVLLSTSQPGLSHIWKNDQKIVIGTQPNNSFYPGSYAVEVMDLNGCISEEVFTINSFPAPVVNVSGTSNKLYCNTIPGGVELVANTDLGGYTFLWFKDGASTGVTGPIYAVTDFGSYHVEVVNQYGCKTVSPDIPFMECCPPDQCGAGGGGGPPAGCNYISQDFQIDVILIDCQHQEFTPQLPGIDPGSTEWYVGSLSDGLLAHITGDVLNYTFNLPGYYQIIMTARINGFPYDASTCGHIDFFNAIVRAVADFKNEGICVNAPIQFEDLTTFLPTEAIASWSWEFDDPSSGLDNQSSLQDPTHIFGSAGDYNVSLNVTMLSGCSSTISKLVHVTAGPNLNPLFEPVYCEDEALALHLPEVAFDVHWDFGDPGSGTLNMVDGDSVFHTYSLPGSYTATVTGHDVYGCVNSGSATPDIRANTLSGLIAIDPAGILCYGDSALLTSPSGGESWMWSTDETTSQISVGESGLYNLILEDQYHCTYSPPPAPVSISPKPEVLIQAREILGAGFYGPWENELHICYGTEYELSAFSNGTGVNYFWSTGDNNQTIQFTDEGGNLQTPGLHEYYVLVIDPLTGCISDTSFITLEVFGLPLLPNIALTGGSSCSFNMNTLTVTNPEAGVHYLWSDQQTGASINVEAAGLYFVTAINDNGCSKKSIPVTIEPSAEVDQIPGGCYIECDPLTVCLPDLDNVVSWNLYQNGNLIGGGAGWVPDYTITSDGSYTLEVTTSNGCVATSDPLDVMLYTGVGSITVLTYFDTDHDGVISAADVLLSGIPVQIFSDDGLQHGMTITETDGGFVFENYPAAGYTAAFDQSLLPSLYQIVIDSVAGSIQTCDDSIVISLLLVENCSVNGPLQIHESCAGEDIMIGDSIWSDTGLYTMHIISAFGCDSVFDIHIIAPVFIEINTIVYVDVDQNGIVSPADTTIQGITIIVDAMINQAPYLDTTDINGSTNGIYMDRPYAVAVDSLDLPNGLMLIYGLDLVPDTLCGKVLFNFLLGPSCADVFVIQQEDLCEGDSILVEGEWLSTSGIHSFVLNPSGPGCDTTLDVYVALLTPPAITGEVDWNCIDFGSIEVEVAGTYPFLYNWSPSVPGDSLLYGLPAGDYTLTVEDVNGCSASDVFEVESGLTLSFNLPSSYDLQSGDSVLLMITGDVITPGLQFQWLPDLFLSCSTCSQPWAFPDSTMTYQVLITDADSCSYELATAIVVRFDSMLLDRLYVPNVFSPNGDGINDHWTMSTRLGHAHVNELTLFDRWGKLISFKADFDLDTWDGWDGTFKGKPHNPGVFVYMADLVLADGQKIRVRGDVTLMR